MLHGAFENADANGNQPVFQSARTVASAAVKAAHTCKIVVYGESARSNLNNPATNPSLPSSVTNPKAQIGTPTCFPIARENTKWT